MSPAADIEVVAAVGARLGECPIWSVDESVLYWEDVEGCAIHRHDPSTGENTSRSLPARPGSFVFSKVPGQFVVAMEHQLVRLDWASGEVTTISDIEAGGTGNRLNDGRCDPAGRFVVGSMFGDVSAERSSGILHQIDGDGVATTLRTDIGVSNGIVFDAERGRMYFTDTPTRRIVVWDYDLDTGERHDERLFFDYTTVRGLPDGACLDVDGCYWSASIFAGALTRITPDGDVDRIVELPIHTPTMPCFGGPNLDTMYVTSLVADDEEHRYEGTGDLRAGSLIALDVGAQGIPETPFMA